MNQSISRCDGSLFVGGRTRLGSVLSTLVLPLLLVLQSSCAYLGGTTDQLDEEAALMQSKEKIAAKESEPTEQKPGLVIPPNPYLLEKAELDPQSQQLFAAAVKAMNAEQYDEAKMLLLELTIVSPQLSGPWFNLGVIENMDQHYAEAENYFKQAILSNPNNSEAYNQLAVMYREQGKFKEAESYYQQALLIWPGYLDAYLNLGMLYELYMGELSKALKQYEIYQSYQQEPERRVKGWIKDLQRRVAKQEASG